MVTPGLLLGPCWVLSVYRLAPLVPGPGGRLAFPEGAATWHVGPVLPAVQTCLREAGNLEISVGPPPFVNVDS